MDDELCRWFDAIDARGYAGMFARPSPSHKAVVERQTVDEWARSMRAEEGVSITDVTSTPIDPPDCMAKLNGLPISIELSELLHGDILHRVNVAKKQNGCPPTFDEMQWSLPLFRELISKIIETKAVKIDRSNLDCIDVLLIDTDERWLSPVQIRDWIAASEFERPDCIRRVYLLRTYVPGHAAHWPNFQIC